MKAKTLSHVARRLGRRSYEVRLKRLGISKIREIARANGKKHVPKQSEGVCSRA